MSSEVPIAEWVEAVAKATADAAWEKRARHLGVLELLEACREYAIVTDDPTRGVVEWERRLAEAARLVLEVGRRLYILDDCPGCDATGVKPRVCPAP